MPKATATAPTADQLRACKDRDAARALLPLTLTRIQLDTVATEVGLRGTSRHNKAALIELIVHHAVGHRISTDAILTSSTYAQIERPAPTAAAVAQYAISSHATLTTRIRQVTESLLAGDPTDPAVLADLAAAAQALVAVASRAAVAGAANAHAAAATDADRDSVDRVLVLRAISETRTESDWSPITGIRAAMWHLDRADQDALLIRMVRDGLVHPIPVANLKALTPADHAAALEIGGQKAHAIQAC